MTVRFCVILLSAMALSTVQAVDRRQQFNADWKFHLGDLEGAQQSGYDDSSWRSLRLPHDWSIEHPVDKNAPSGGRGGYVRTGVGWYRKTLIRTDAQLERNTIILFDGVYENSDVWINGRHLGRRPNGYVSFYYNLTPHLRSGENVLAVRVDNSRQPNSRWYTGSGIYRNVWLIETAATYIPIWGVHVTTPQVDKVAATVAVTTTIHNSGTTQVNGRLIAEILTGNETVVAKAETGFSVATKQEERLKQQLQIAKPRHWELDDPYLYMLRTQVWMAGAVVDEVRTPFGVRTLTYDAHNGFALNGKPTKMRGVNLHHDAGCVGAAVPIGVWERRLELLKAMGCNAIRTAHNPVAPEFLDLCDRMGFLVMNEVFDEWTHGKIKHGYSNYFAEWSERDLTDVLRRDHNHPSVVLWSVGNEVWEQTTKEGPAIARRLIDICHREDPTRPVTVGCDNVGADRHPTTDEFLNTLDIVGYNYGDRWRARRELVVSLDKIKHPNWKMIGTESSSANNGGVRGSYWVGTDPQKVNAGYVHGVIRGSHMLKFVATRPYYIGDFFWTGFDYLGECRWPRRAAMAGVMDTCGFPKDEYYLYQSQWTEKPMLHILPHWNWKGREGQVFPILVYSNCDVVELFVNERSFGEKRLAFPRQGTAGQWNAYAEPRVLPTTSDLHLAWDVPYEAGLVRAVGKRNGKVVARASIRTTGPAQQIRLISDRETLRANSDDVAHVRVEVVDNRGDRVPDAGQLVRFELTGPARLLGIDNGRAWDHEPYTSGKRHVHNGLALAIIQAIEKPGEVMLTARADGLKGGQVKLQITP